MKNTIARDLMAFLGNPRDGRKVIVFKWIMLTLYYLAFWFHFNLAAGRLVAGEIDDAARWFKTTGMIAAVAAFGIWVDGALYRWMDREIAKIKRGQS